MNYGQNAQAQSMAGAALGSGPKAVSIMEDTANTIEAGMAGLQQVHGRLSSLSLRLLGPVPEAVENDKIMPAPTTAIGRIQYAARDFHRLLERINREIQRIEEL